MRSAKRSSVKKTIDLWSAKLETYLSTHAFEVLSLAIYSAAVVLQFIWGAHDEFHFQPDDTNLRWYICIARGAGYVLNLTCALVILMAARLLSTKLRETPLQYIVPLDKAFPKFHVIIGYTIAGALLIHVPFHLTWLTAYDQWAGGLWGFTMSAATGAFLLPIFVVMLITALPFNRRKRFRLFYIVHMIGAFFFFALLIFHGMYRTVPETYKWITGPIIVYIIDRVVRHYKINTAGLELSSEHSLLKGRDILELRVPRLFDYRAGQYAEILVPSISKEWHPFTIASAPHEKTMVFFIKALGNWTKTLRDAFVARQQGDVTEPLMVQIRGPFGAPAQHVKGYDRVVLISGGVGSTPFAAISKHLQHLNKVENQTVQKNKRKHFNGLYEIEQRIRRTISSLYDVNIDVDDSTPVDEIEEQRRQHLVDMLNLTAENQVGCPAVDACHSDHCILADTPPTPTKAQETTDANAIELPDRSRALPTAANFASRRLPRPATTRTRTNEDSSFEYSDREQAAMRVSDDSEISDSNVDLQYSSSSQLTSTFTDEPSYILDMDSTNFQKPSTFGYQKSARQKLAHLYERRSKLLSFLHTTRVMMALLLTLLVRIILVCVMSIFDLGELNFTGSHIDENWLVASDTILGIILTTTLSLTIALEISYMGKRFFKNFWRCVDFFVFIPLSVLSNTGGLRKWTGHPPTGVVIFIHFIFLIPTMLFLLSARMYRSIGSRTLLDNGKCSCDCKCNKTIPDVDFVWTTPRGGEDKWLRDELYPLANGTELRLHRYVTREKEEDMEASEEFISIAKAGRPDWDALFSQIAEEAPSRVRIGVFFCGPHPMGAAVMKSIRKVEIISNLRGAYLEATPDHVLVDDLKLNSISDVARLRSYGCKVRFVFREENFG
uniref:NAD(P)H oxidase NOX4 n=1 Tax=Asparagopsis taxiformis TaxID=260499 RepID=A0A6M8PX50_9FLOR|nr:NAD(P)H oxidase NOX4 [Asparagopsis taxiformis]